MKLFFRIQEKKTDENKSSSVKKREKRHSNKPF